MLGKRTGGRRSIQLIHNLLEKKNYTDLKKAAEDMKDRLEYSKKRLNVQITEVALIIIMTDEVALLL